MQATDCDLHGAALRLHSTVKFNTSLPGVRSPESLAFTALPSGATINNLNLLSSCWSAVYTIRELCGDHGKSGPARFRTFPFATNGPDTCTLSEPSGVAVNSSNIVSAHAVLHFSSLAKNAATSAKKSRSFLIFASSRRSRINSTSWARPCRQPIGYLARTGPASNGRATPRRHPDPLPPGVVLHPASPPPVPLRAELFVVLPSL